MTPNYPYYDPYAASQPHGGHPPMGGPAGPTGPGFGAGSAAQPRRGRRVLATGLVALAAASIVGGIALGEIAVHKWRAGTINGSGSTAQLLPTIPGDMNRGAGGTSSGVSPATAAQSKGIVTVVSVLRYQNAKSAGTGMILTSDGEVLTNNHVINGATRVIVTVPSTGRSYRADVVGTDPAEDVAVLQLRNAAGLATASVGTSSGVEVGDRIVGVGNAAGTGRLRASGGTVTALNRTITATDELGRDSERLTGLIQVDAAIISGDSGGPLYDAAGKVIGMDTAASAQQSAHAAYAIPIDSALDIVDKIETGVETANIHIGLPAFLGVGIASGGTDGAGVNTLLPGGPAADAGITPGSTITAIDGTTVTSAESLRAVLRGYEPGQEAVVAWTARDGSRETATVTLGTGPAD